MIDRSDIEKLKRYRKGTSGAEDKQYVYSLFAENEDDKLLKNHLKNEFYNHLKTDTDENHNLAYLLDKIHHVLHKKEHKQKDTVVRKIYKWYNVAAAALLIPVLIAGGIWFMRQNQMITAMEESAVSSTIHAPLGARIEFTLPDGSSGWLNSGSSIQYSIPFEHNRKVEILGEAWFNVAHDEDSPFEVISGVSKVRVLGTRFNVNAYPDESYTEVVLEEGSVEFFTSGLSSNVVLQPDERLVLADGKVNINKTEAVKYSAWKDGKLVFRGDTMLEVARRIGRWYNVRVEVVDEELKNYTFRGTFQDDSLEEVLNYIGMTSPIGFEIGSRKLLDDGTVAKKHVLLFKK